MTHIPGLPMIRDSRVNLTEFARQSHHCVPEEGTKIEDVLRDEYWSMVSYKFKPCDIIEVHAEDGSFFAELYVRAAGKNWAKVALLRKVDLEPAQTAVANPDYEVAWKGPHRKFSAIRTSDNEIVKDGFDTREQAAEYLKSHARAMAA